MGKRWVNSVISLLLCLVLVAALVLPVLADENTEGNTGTQKTSEQTQEGSKDQDTGKDTSKDQNTDKDKDTGTDQNPDKDKDTGKDQNPDKDQDTGKDQNTDKDKDTDKDQSGNQDTTKPSTHEHNWGTRNETKKATCTEAGTMEYTCACGEKKTVAIEAKGHSYDNVCDPDCNTCGAKRDVSHNPGKTWSRDASGHWHICASCKEKVDIGNHYPGPAATEEKDQICMTCGYLLTRKKGHVHKYETTLTSDESGHWYPCEGCSEQKDFTEHVYDDPCDPDCNVCGYKRASAHYYGDSLQYDKEVHWGICTLCGEVGTKDAHIPGAEASEHTPQICVVCGMQLAPALDHVHGAEEWTVDETGHQKICDCGEILEEGLHSWDGGRKNPDSTVTYTCTQCGAEKTEGTPKEGNTSSIPWVLVLVAVISLACGVTAVVIFIRIFGKKPKGKFSR